MNNYDTSKTWRKIQIASKRYLMLTGSFLVAFSREILLGKAGCVLKDADGNNLPMDYYNSACARNRKRAAALKNDSLLTSSNDDRSTIQLNRNRFKYLNRIHNRLITLTNSFQYKLIELCPKLKLYL